MWDEKEDACMNDEVIEGNGHPRITSANTWDMAHSVVLQNYGVVVNMVHVNSSILTLGFLIMFNVNI
jgi:hypothetical protein